LPTQSLYTDDLFITAESEKVLVSSRGAIKCRIIIMNNHREKIDELTEFKYLGSLIQAESERLSRPESTQPGRSCVNNMELYATAINHTGYRSRLTAQSRSQYFCM